MVPVGDEPVLAEFPEVVFDPLDEVALAVVMGDQGHVLTHRIQVIHSNSLGWFSRLLWILIDVRDEVVNQG